MCAVPPQTVDTIEYVKRPERLGLGAQPLALPDDKSKPVKMGELAALGRARQARACMLLLLDRVMCH